MSKARVRVAVALGCLTILALCLNVAMIRRYLRASALLQECGTPSEKQVLLGGVEQLRLQLDDLEDLSGKLISEESNLGERAEASRLRLARLKADVGVINDDLRRADEFRRAIDRASCDGNYFHLMRVEHAPGAKAANGEFNDVGRRFLRAGYWVYAHPYWFVWERCREEEEEAQRRKRDKDARDAQFRADAAQQRDLDAKYGSGIDARIMAQDFVKQSLMHPSTAKFPFFSLGHAFLDVAQGRWLVTGTVKAKNAFGLELTYHYVVVLRKVGADRWQLVDIAMQEKGT